MITLSLILLVFFLIWIFLTATLAKSLFYLGEVRADLLFEKYPKRFYYRLFHKAIFDKKNYSLLISTVKFSANHARLGFGITLAVFLIALYSRLSISYLILIFLGIFFIYELLSDLLPRFFGLRSKEGAFRFSSPLASIFLFLSFPLSCIFTIWESRFSKKQKDQWEISYIEEDLKETILHILYDTDLKEPLNAFDKKLLESVVRFKERIVREVMIPRVDLFCLPADLSIREAAQLLAEQGYSRTPLYSENIDNILGVLLYKDVLELYMECEKGKKDWTALDASVETLANKVFYTPETKKISQLLQEFRSKQMHMAIVIDEYGGTEGIVTIEDLLEEIVGEIGDEYDVDEEALYSLQPTGEWIVDARMSINDAENVFGIEIPEEGDYDTLGGYVFDVVQSIPQKGYIIHHDLFDLEVISTTERSIEKVKIIPKGKIDLNQEL